MRSEIIAIADLLRKELPLGQIKAYSFGSATREDENPNDVDILITYNDTSLPEKIRALMKSLGYLPIHLIFLTPEEEIETNFIAAQNCVLI